jgi:hypothetical protein
MNRHFTAIEAFTSPDILPLASLADALSYAVDEVEAEGGRADQDPAVLLLGGAIAFRTHADVVSMDGFTRLLRECQHQLDSRELQ